MVAGIGAPPEAVLAVALAVALAVVVEDTPAVEVGLLLGIDKMDTHRIVPQFADRNSCTF